MPAPTPNDPPARPTRRRWLLAAFLLLSLLAYRQLYVRPAAQPPSATAGQPGRPGGGPGGGMNRSIPVAVAAATPADVPIHLQALGTVVPRNTVTVRTRIDGQLMQLHFTEGQLVKAGAPLADIDPRPYQVQLQQAEGQLARDQALLANARLDLQRYRSLHAQDSIARQQLDTQEALVRQYEAAIKTDQAQIDNARLQLTYARITAPISGRTGLRQVDPGNLVKTGDANGIVVITQLQPITVVFSLPEDQLPRLMPRIQRGQSLPVELFDRENRQPLARGQLLTIDNQIDTTTGTVKLKAQFDNADLRLYPNQFVNARLRADVLHQVLTVPAAALQRSAQGPIVYVVNDDNTVSLRKVRPGAVDGERLVIEDGLQAGERVVTEGLDKLRDGARIELIERRRDGRGAGQKPAGPPDAGAPSATAREGARRPSAP